MNRDPARMFDAGIRMIRSQKKLRREPPRFGMECPHCDRRYECWMVTNILFQQFFPNRKGTPCIQCFETIIGRALEITDFSSALCNWYVFTAYARGRMISTCDRDPFAVDPDHWETAFRICFRHIFNPEYDRSGNEFRQIIIRTVVNEINERIPIDERQL